MKKLDEILDFIWELFRVLLVVAFFATLFLPKCNAQNCETYFNDKMKSGDTLIMPCDSLIIVSIPRLRLTLSNERSKLIKIIKLNFQKDEAVNALVAAHNNELGAVRKQLSACEKAYNSVFDSTKFYLATAKANNDAAKQTLKSLEYHTDKRISYLEDEKKALLKKSRLEKWLFGGAGVGVGALIFGIISVVR